MLKTIPPIIVRSKGFHTDLQLSIANQDTPFRFYCLDSYQDILSFLAKSEASFLLLTDVDNEEADFCDFLIKVSRLKPDLPRIFMGHELQEKNYRFLINSGTLLRVVNLPMKSDEIIKIFLNLSIEKQISLDRSVLIKESSGQNKELEKLTGNLEATVAERTRYIEASHHEQNEKLNRERQLIRFIREVEVQETLMDLLFVFRKELRKQASVGDPILINYIHDGEMCFYYYSRDDWQRSSLLKRIPQNEMSLFFANFFGRPFGQSVTMNINENFLLCVEMNLSENKINMIKDFINERLGIFKIVLERINFENQIHKELHRWQETFDGMLSPIAIIDKDFTVIRGNKRFSNYLSINRKCYEMFANQKAPCEGCPLISGSSAIQLSQNFFNVYHYPIHSKESESPTVFVHEYLDVTEERRLFQKIVQTEKMEAIGLLAGNVAHELNNPLTGIKSLAQVLKSEITNNSTLKQDLDEIEKAAERSQKIIQNLLNFSASESPLEKVCLDDVVENTLPLIKSLLRKHRTKFELFSKDYFVDAETQLLQQVLINLITNACHAMTGPGELSIKTFVDGNHVIMSVCDTGPGVPLEFQNKIFESFFTTKQQGQGTGLGLSLSKSIVEKFNGEIIYKDNIPAGACFQIIFPIANRSEVRDENFSN